MYSYSPKSKKKKEKLICALLLATGFALFLPSTHPQTPLPMLFQLGAVILLTVALMFGGRYLARNYTYAVSSAEDGSDRLDLTVTEQYGRRLSVVCRISVDQIEVITPITPQNQKEVAAMTKGKRTFTYVSELQPSGLRLLTVRMDEEVFYLKIDTDESLLRALTLN